MPNQPFNLDTFKMGYFILYRNTGGLFGNAIRKKQLAAGISSDNAEYTHAEVSGGGRHSTNISPPISKLVDITEVHKGRHVRLVRLRNDEYEQGKRYKVAYFSATLCNKGYDLKGVLAFVFKWLKHDNRLWFCSEGVAWALSMVFPEALGRKPEECMPGHFLDPNRFELVWEGGIGNGTKTD